MDQKPADEQPESPWQYQQDGPTLPQVENVPSPTVSARPPEQAVVSDEEDQQLAIPQIPASNPLFSWHSAEFIFHSKTMGWYALLGVGTLALAVLTYLVTRDIISAVIISVAGLAFGIYAARKPRDIEYALDATGLTIGEKHVAYAQFRSFSVMDEGQLTSVSLFPLKRFGQLATIYFDRKDETAITNILSSHLPVEQHTRDAVDNLMRRIHF